MSVFASLMIVAAGASAPRGTERLTREEIIEDVLAHIVFRPYACPDDAQTERISPEEEAALREELARHAWSVGFIPPVFENLPEGTRASVLGDEVRMVSKDREYCLAALEARLLYRVNAVETARVMPVLDDLQQAELVRRVDELADSVAASLRRHLSPPLEEADIQREADAVRRGPQLYMRHRTCPWYKRVPTREEIQCLAHWFDSELERAKPGAFERASLALPSPDAPDYQERLATWLHRVWLPEVTARLRWELWKATELADRTALEEARKRRPPEYQQIHERFLELELRKHAENRALWEAHSKAFIAAAQEEFHRRMRIHAYAAGQPATNAPGPEWAPPPAPREPLVSPQRREVKIELPSSRPASQPSDARPGP